MSLVIILFLLAVLFAVFFFFVLVGTVLSFLPWIIVGLIAGWAASAITESKHGILGDILLGLAGSVIGGVIYVALTHHAVGGAFSLTRIVVSIVGAVILLLVIKAVGGKA